MTTIPWLATLWMMAAAPQAVTPPPAPPPAEDASPMRYYPERAQRMEVGGKATLECQVTAEGGLEDCKVLSETPLDYGFGEAALKMSKLFKMRPKTVDGKPVAGGRIVIPVNFAVPK